MTYTTGRYLKYSDEGMKQDECLSTDLCLALQVIPLISVNPLFTDTWGSEVRVEELRPQHHSVSRHWHAIAWDTGGCCLLCTYCKMSCSSLDSALLKRIHL